jgi:acetyl esterase/lipase
MPVEAPEGQTGLRIMYHSTDAEDEDRAVTGVVYYPNAEPTTPDGGWPILAWAHGTSGIAPACAPSRLPLAPPDYGIEGVRVATDYIGLGPEGELHPYLSAAAEGNAVIDSVVAAQNLAEARAGDRWVVAGHSQGGHAVLVASEMAKERLPGSPLLGAVAIAPGSQLGESYGDDVQIRIITTMVLFGAAYEDPDIDPSEYLGPQVYDVAADAAQNRCVGEVISSLLPLATSPDYWQVDPKTGSLGEAWVEENDPGRVPSDTPLFLVQGGQDVIVVPARTEALFERLCDLGDTVDRLDLPNAGHDTEPAEAADEITAWIADRFADVQPENDC